jgi:rhodanese-related sulfurtransferase
MAVDVNSEDALRIRKLVPLATLPGSLFNELCSEITVEEIRDALLFRRGDSKNELFYLLEGEVLLQAEGLIIEVVSSAHESAKFALAHQLPRKIDAFAKGVVRFVRVDAEKVNNPPVLEYKEESEMVVVEEEIDENSDDWMTILLKLPIFQRLPPANLQKILLALEEVTVAQGEVIIEQGAEGDYFYFLKSGQCEISRKPTPISKSIRLAVLEKGEIFGEDALISGAPRTVSVTASTDVTLLRLDKSRFVSLIKTPSLVFVSYDEMAVLRDEGGAVLDLRPLDEFEQGHIEGSINVQFFSLRMQLKSLNRDRPVVVVCRNGRISEAGAFFLLKNRFKAYILKGGMESVPGAFIAESAKNRTGTTVEAPLQAAQDNWMPEGRDVSLDEQLLKLKKENEVLRRTVKQLNARCSQLEEEKKRIEDRFATLSRHFEQLKHMLQKLKNNT